jgi:hypothetical protein
MRGAKWMMEALGLEEANDELRRLLKLRRKTEEDHRRINELQYGVIPALEGADLFLGAGDDIKTIFVFPFSHDDNANNIQYRLRITLSDLIDDTIKNHGGDTDKFRELSAHLRAIAQHIDDEIRGKSGE